MGYEKKVFEDEKIKMVHELTNKLKIKDIAAFIEILEKEIEKE